MTTRNFDALFAPKAIALIGASNEPGSVGAVLAANLLSAGFKGELLLVNPHQDVIAGRKAYRTIAALPVAPDLAVIATPAPTVAPLMRELGARGCRAAIVISAGAGLRAAVLEAARPFLMRVIGPNCLGFLSPGIGVNASFAHLNARSGDIALVTQSGAIATSMLDWASGRELGFSHILSLGDMSDIDFGDVLDFLAFDQATRSILLYVESITHARKFMSAARIAARAKPVIVVKAGRSDAGMRAAASHTGALAGADAVFDAAFDRAGMLRVDTLRDLFDAAETLASGARVRGDRLTVVTNGGGLGVIAADALEAGGGRLTVLSHDGLGRLDAALPKAWSHNNPIDILGDAHPERYQAALSALQDAPGQDAILVMNCPTGVADNAANAEPLIEAQARRGNVPLLACWMGGATTGPIRERLSRAGVANYETPDEAVRAFLHLAAYARNQNALLETPLPMAPRAEDRAEARRVIGAVLAEGRTLLTEFEAKAVLSAYGVPVVKTLRAADPAAAGRAAAALGGNVALKILSRDITHKSDVGGVRLNLEGERAIEAAAEEMLARVRAAAPDARLDGFTIQEMAHRPHAHELIAGVAKDRTFGPVILFGQGGVAVEVLADRVMGLPPLNSVLAKAMIEKTRVAKLLAGYRDRPPANRLAIAEVLVALSDMIIDLPEIAELDINPLLADAQGVIALDARIVVSATAGDEGFDRLAILPYPAALSREIELADRASFRVRPIRPEDAPALMDMARRTDAADLRLRFHGAVRGLDEAAAARLSQIDYDREMALVAIAPDQSFAGVARLVFDPDFSRAEYAIIVRSDLQGRGLGRALLAEALAYARLRGASTVWGDVLIENGEMIALARGLGAHLQQIEGASELTRTSFHLDT